MSREQTKSVHYIQLLNEARCEGNWEAVPELVRKVKKHAPQRTCLALTAECEHAVIQASAPRPGTARPTTARPSTAIPPTTPANIAQYIPLLLEAIDKERTYVEDDFQAQVCLGWIHWELGEPSLAVARLPKDIEQEFSQLDGTNKESTEWTRVCALKASHIKGSSLRKNGVISEAMETYESALPILTSVPPGEKQAKEMRTWTELFLTGFCMLSAHAVKSKISPILETETLSAFRAWAKFWEAQGPAPVGGHAIQTDVSRRRVWKEYYVTISDLLQEGLPYPITPLTSAYAETSTKLQQRAELKKVEAKYETLLLSEVSFPRAEEASEEVEDFVDVVIQNWRILCGNSWKEQDLGEGGAEAVSRGVLDILYRAATKTFHSTAILRHLFTVHLAVAEFDLAFKAFDTYMDIVKKGKARIEKTGEEEVGLDDDEMVLQTASECIKALCRHGSRRGAEKANDLGQFFEDWLERHHPIQQKTPNGGSIQDDDSTKAASAIQPQVFAKAWRCIGIGHAQWARLMFDAPLRAEFQLRAIKCFRKALLPQYESTTDVETLFALGTILAERRELPAAIEVVKSGLLPHSSTGNILKAHAGYFTRERMLIPLWHLMALLLSARHEFMTAARSCEGAFEQFQDPKNLFGQEELNGAYRSTHLNEKATSRNQGVVDDMSDFEKESVLEVKMTQLSLIEVLEGPEIAVNASDELVSLYTRLFGNPRKTAPVKVPSTALVVPPKSSAGTIRSIRGSLFGRSARSVRKLETESTINEEPLPPVPRPQTTQTVASLPAPKIQVIQENGLAAKKSVSSKSRTQHHQEKLQKRSDSVRKTGLDGARSRSASSSSRNRLPSQSQEEQYFTPPVDAQDRVQWLETKTGPNSSQQLSHRERTPLSAPSEHAILKSHRLTLSKNPVTRFPKDQERRRRIAILVKVWLLIGSFYRRASMFEDAKGAIEEAEQLIKGMEDELMKEINGNVSADHAGWGGGRNVGELWGDVFAERGHLAIAQEASYTAMTHFESALTHSPDHPTAIVGLSNILLDIYTENLLPLPSVPSLVLPAIPSGASVATLSTSTVAMTPLASQPHPPQPSSSVPFTQHGPLGLPSATAQSVAAIKTTQNANATPASTTSSLKPSYKETSTALLDRLAARDRAYGLLTTLTKLGTGWNNSEAWFALARAYEECGQPNKAREVLWWCVELEEGRAVRDWTVIGGGGYVL